MLRLSLTLAATITIALASSTAATVFAQQPQPAAPQPQAPQKSRGEAFDLLMKAREHIAKGDFAASEAPLRKAETLLQWEKQPDQEVVANVMQQLGENAMGRGEWIAAETLLRKALVARVKHAGEDDPLTAIARSSLGEVLLYQDRHADAAAVLLRAIEVFDKYEMPPAFVVRHGRALLTYGQVLDERNQALEAIKVLERAVKILEPVEGELGRTRLLALSRLPRPISETGDLSKAEIVARQFLALAQRTKPIDEELVVSAMGSVATITSRKGDHSQAEVLFKDAIERGEKKLGAEHPTTVSVMSELAGSRAVAVNRGVEIDRADTDRLYQRVIALDEKAHTIMLWSALEGYGLFLDSTDRNVEAEAMFRRAIAHAKTTVGVRSTLLSNLALAIEKRGQLDEAERLLREAITLGEKNDGRSTTSTHNLAGLLLRRGRAREALPLLKRSQDEVDSELDDVIKGANDAQRRSILGRFVRESRFPVPTHLHDLPNDPEAAKLALRTILRHKGRALDAGHSTVQLLRRRASPADTKLLDELAAARTELAQSTFANAPPATRNPLQARVDRLEETLGRKFAEIATESKPIEVENVQRALRPGQALVEITVYRKFEADPKQFARWGDERYAAYVLFPDGKIEARDLGEASKIDPLARRVRAEIGKGGARFHDDARALDELVMRPIRAMLGVGGASVARDVWLSAEGALHLVPFGALIDETERYGIDRYRFNLLTSGRDLLRYSAKPTEKVAPKQAPALIIAAPDFDTAVAASNSANGEAEIGGLRFGPLPGTEVESANIAKLVPDAQRLVAKQATKSVLMNAHGPRFLHVASHGFFLSPSADEAKQEQRALKLDTSSSTTNNKLVVPKDPLLQSGIAFAGANKSPRQALLTALEASSLDLWGTELVALSACETGLGEVERGEGVFGLRRALVLAGAETQLISLWKVDDDATSALMVSYYDHVLKGAGRSDALREAQLAMLANPKTSHPYYWAAFVVSGDDRTLDHRAPGSPPRESKNVIASKAVLASAPKVSPGPRSSCACDIMGQGASTSNGWALWTTLLLGLAVLARKR